MIEGVVSLVGQFIWIVGVPLAVITLFLMVPIAVTKNAGGVAERLSKLPGINPDGGLQAGLVAFAYPLALVALVGVALTVATGTMDEGPADDSIAGEDVADSSDDGVDDTEPADPPKSADGEDGSEESGDDESNEEYSEYVDQMTIQVYEFEQRPYGHLDHGTLSIYDPAGNLVDQQEISDETTPDSLAVNLLSGLTPGVNYTASVTDADGWPTVNVSFDPADYDYDRRLNITVGYFVNGTDSHRSVFLDDATELPGRGGYITVGYAEYAENGDAFRIRTDALHDLDHFDHEWLDKTYTDGETGETFFNRAGEWELDPDRVLTGIDGPQKQRYVRMRPLIKEAANVDEKRVYLGQQTLNNTGVQEELPNEPLVERLPQVEEAASAHDGRVVDVYYFEPPSGDPSYGRTLYIDVETHHLLRMQYPDTRTESGEPIWVTIDFWDHGNVDSVEDYDPSELGR